LHIGEAASNLGGFPASESLTFVGGQVQIGGASLRDSNALGESSLIGTVTLSESPSVNVLIALKSSSSNATFANGQTVSSVAVLANHNSAQFLINTNVVGVQVPVTITATYGPSMPTATFTIQYLKGFTLTPSTVYGGTPSVAQVTLSGPPPLAGAPITLTSSATGLVPTPPATALNLINGETSKTCNLTTAAVASQKTVTVTAKLAGITISKSLVIEPAVLSSVSPTSQTISAGRSMTGTVTLLGLAALNTAVSLTSSNPSYLTVPATATVNAQSSSGQFTINATLASDLLLGNVNVTITAKYGAVTKTCVVTVKGRTLHL
jgi:hypothetical protein